MEIILLKDIENLGLANSLVTVKPGFARNFLIPTGAAVVANKQNKNSLMQKIRKQEERATAILADAKTLAEKVATITLKIDAKSGTSGKIFGSVTNVQLAEVFNTEFNTNLERRKFTLPAEVKMLGKYVGSVRLHKDVISEVNFEVYTKAEATTEDAE